MTDRDRTERVDRWLRRGLGPPPGSARRVAVGALESARPNARPRLAFVLPAILAIALAAGLWWRGGAGTPVAPPPPSPTGPSVRIANFGELVTVVDPAGAAWLSGPKRHVDASSPRLIIRLGESHDPL